MGIVFTGVNTFIFGKIVISIGKVIKKKPLLNKRFESDVFDIYFYSKFGVLLPMFAVVLLIYPLMHQENDQLLNFLTSSYGIGILTLMMVLLAAYIITPKKLVISDERIYQILRFNVQSKVCDLSKVKGFGFNVDNMLILEFEKNRDCLKKKKIHNKFNASERSALKTQLEKII